MKKKTYIYLAIVSALTIFLISYLITINNLSDGKELKESDLVSELSTLSEADTQENIQETSIPAPEKSTWEVMRKTALSGMTDDEIETLTSTIKKRNEALERRLTYENYEIALSNSSSLLWNEFMSTGEVQIGWFVDQNVLDDPVTKNMTKDELYQKYGEPIVTDNEYDGHSFISEMTELKNTVQNDELKKDFDHMIELMQSAMENRTVNDIMEIHKILHDMDYYLLRYAPDLYHGYTRDRSSLNKYYGSLYFYQNTELQ